jgi:hypothetical protein
MTIASSCRDVCEALVIANLVGDGEGESSCVDSGGLTSICSLLEPGFRDEAVGLRVMIVWLNRCVQTRANRWFECVLDNNKMARVRPAS